MPQLLFISAVNAQTRLQNPPVRFDTVQPTANQGRLTNRGVIKKSDSTDCEDCKVTLRALDLKKVPTERQLRQAGQFGGALSPIGNADVDKLEAEMDKQLKAKGIAPAVAAAAPEITVAGRLGKLKREKIQKLKDINLSFGKAMQEWNKHNYRPAAKMLEKHVEDYPDSPWAGEALLHLGCDSKYNGRFAEAQARYDQILQATSNDPNDPSFEIHQKAKIRWADLDISTGKINEAQAKLRDILASDTDWRRQTWARDWLHQSQIYKKNAKGLRACGSEALGYMLASLNYSEASRVVSKMTPPRDSGFNLAELRQISARYGVPLEGFRATPEQLSSLATPLLLHYDFDKATPRLDNLTLAIGKAVTQIRSADSKTKLNPVEKKMYSPRNRAGHYVVANRIDAKKRTVALFDPQSGRYYTLSFDQLKREWSGSGLRRVVKQSVAQQANTSSPRVASLPAGEMQETVGGCCGVLRPSNAPGKWPWDFGDSDCNETKGSPYLTVNSLSMNVRIEDTPLWYETPIGPDVSFTMSYNSLDSINQNTVVGNKWVFNFGSYLVEDTGAGGGVVTVFMSDGAQRNFYPDSSGQYHAQKGTFERLAKRSVTRYELISPTGDRMIYDIPAGTDSLQSMLVEVRDRWGYSLKLGYTTGFTVQLTTITDAQGKVTGLVYDQDGHIIKVRDPFGREAKFDYDQGNLVRAIDMEGNVFNYSYNNRIELTQINSAQGITKVETGYAYGDDPYSQTYLTVTNPKGEKTRYVWDGIFEGPQFSRLIDKRGAETLYYIEEVIDGVPKVTRIVNPLGQTTYVTYEREHGLPAKVTDVRGATTAVQYNVEGQVVKSIDSKGRMAQFFYDSANGIDLLSAKDSRGRIVGTFSYNEKHQPVSSTDEQGRYTSRTYTAWGATLSETDAENHVSTITYDQVTKRPLSIIVDGVTQGSVTYDSKGRPLTNTDMTGLTVSYSYNDLDKPTRVNYPDGTFTSIDYSCCSLPGVLRDRAGRKTYFDYDELNRVVRIQDPSGQTLEFDYDAEGNLISLQDSRGTKTRFSYDSLNRLTSKTYADGTKEVISFDDGNNIVARRDSAGNVIRSTYNEVGNLTYVDYPKMADVSIKYNDLDQVIEVRDSLGVTRISYDVEDRVKTIDGPWDNDLLVYNYDTDGRLTGTQIGMGNSISQQINYSYDPLERLASLTSAAGTFTPTYVGNTDMVSRITYPNSTYTDYLYDSSNRLVHQELKKNNGSLLALYNFTFDGSNYENRGMMTGLERKIGNEPLEQVNWAFNDNNQLIGEKTTQIASVQNPTVASPRTVTFAIDGMGNRTSETQSQGTQTINTSWLSNPLNQMTSVTQNVIEGGTTTNFAQSLIYDAIGNLTEQTQSGADLQNTSNLSYSYDDANRLSQIVRRDAVTKALVHKSEFVYDAVNRRRIAKEFTWNTTTNMWQLGDEQRFVYDGMDVVQERDGQNVVTSNLTRLGNIGGLLARTTSTTQGVAHHFLHSDGSGNVSGVSSSTGNMLAWAKYDAFGKRVVGGQADLFGSYGFQSKWTHGASGLVDFGFRFYSISQGRFINRDPLEESGGVNLYSFAEHNPANLTDEYGLYFVVPMLVGGMSSVAIGYVMAKLLGDCYTLKDAAKDFLVGALFTGAAGIGSKLLKARYALKQGEKLHVWLDVPFMLNRTTKFLGRTFNAKAWTLRHADKGWLDLRMGGPWGGSVNNGLKGLFTTKTATQGPPQILGPVRASKMWPEFGLFPPTWWKGFAGQFAYSQNPALSAAREAAGTGLVTGGLGNLGRVYDYLYP